MELASLLILILLPPADATGDTALAIESSLRHELGEVTMAIAPDTLVTPAMWQGEAAQMRARFVAHVIWKARDRASIELLARPSAGAGSSGKVARELVFAPQDGKSERGRAIGLVIAALLRESPVSAWMESPRGRIEPAGGEDGRSRLVLGGLFAAERVRGGAWALGPELTYEFGLSRALRLRAAGTALFSSPDKYTEIGVGAGARWDLLLSQDGRHALGIGLGADIFHEGGTGPGEHGGGDSVWNAALAPNLGGRLTLWRTVRLASEAGLRATLRTMTLSTGEDTSLARYGLSRWRPYFALGLELGL
jgi:hypothetical protein